MPQPRRELLRDKIGLPGWGFLLFIPLVVLLSLYVLLVVVGRPHVVKGNSMFPTLKDGNRILVVKYRFGNTPNRGDIVTFRDVKGDPEFLVKRVIAIGGDKLTFTDRRIIVNDKYTYFSSSTRVKSNFTTLLPDNAVFVLGDNESQSYDSRFFGPVPLENITGHAVFVFWPPGDISTL